MLPQGGKGSTNHRPPGSLLPCAQSPGSGALNTQLSLGCANLAEEASEEGWASGPIPHHDVRASARAAICSKKHQGDRLAAQLSPICWKPVEKSPDLVGPQPFHCQNEGLGLHKPRIISL